MRTYNLLTEFPTLMAMVQFADAFVTRPQQVTLHDMVKSGEWCPCPEIVPHVGAGKKHATWPTSFNNVIRLSAMGISVAVQLIMHVLGSANRWVTVFKICARPPTLTGKNGVSPASFPSLPYINFGKIVLRSGKLQILFWRLGLVQERCNSIASAMELRLSCTNTLTWGSRMIAFSKHWSWWSWLFKFYLEAWCPFVNAQMVCPV